MRSLEYFASATLAPLFEVFEVYDNPNHKVYQSLLEDLQEITDEDMAWFDEHSNFRYDSRIKGDEMKRRLYCFIGLVEVEIDKLRVNSLTNNDMPPLPYSHPSLAGLTLDNNYMAKVEDFDFVKGGFMKGNEVFMLIPSTNATNSSYWLLQHLFEIERLDFLKIRLDPLIHQSLDDFNPMFYKMQVYGKALNWERLKELKAEEHTQFIPDILSGSDIVRTDLVWQPNKGEIHFTCEELPSVDYLDQRGSRYFHAIFEQETGLLKHCDGAIRFYTSDEYEKRIENHVRANTITRIGKRIKVFQIDIPDQELNKGHLSHKNFIDLVTSFYVWNQDVYDYFNSN